MMNWNSTNGQTTKEMYKLDQANGGNKLAANGSGGAKRRPTCSSGLQQTRQEEEEI